MKKKYVLSIIYLSVFLILAACGSSNKTEVKEDRNIESEIEVKKENNSEEKVKEDTEGSAQSSEEESADNEPELIEAIETAPVYPEISFKNVNWFYGSPDLQPTGGIWLYTSETIPNGYENTIDWELNDFLLIQVNNAKYVNHKLAIQALQLIEDDVVKIVVSLKPDEPNGDSTEKLVPRRYASVEKGQLEDKKYIVETVEGEFVDVSMQVKTSEIKGIEEE